MKLALHLGYSGPVASVDLEKVLEAERLGYDSVWTAEAYGSDAVVPAAWLAARTERIHVGTAIMQIPARTPAMTAMTAMTLDGLSGGRFRLGLGVSGPQVVEGWYGQPFSKPLARTREYVSIIRKVLARKEPVTNEGPHYPLPYKGEGAWGLGKPLRPIVRPLRPDIPIWLGAEGPKNVALAAEICDGWFPLYYSPYRPEVYAEQIRHAKPGFEIAPLVFFNVSDDVETALLPVKAMLGFYIGGMGAKKHNFHKELMARMGYEAEANRIQELFFDGKRDEAIAAVPDRFADEIALVGPVERIRDRLQAWESTPVTMLLVMSHDLSLVRTVAEAVLR